MRHREPRTSRSSQAAANPRTRLLARAARPAALGFCGLMAMGAGTAEAQRGGKSGPFMANVKLGASIPVYIKDLPSGFSTLDAVPAQFAMQLELGFALDRGRSAYLTFPFQFHVGQKSSSIPFLGTFTATFATVIVPVAFQYDIAIPAISGLYIYPRATLGYAAVVTSSGSSSNTVSSGIVIPEFGIKYVFRQRVNFGFEPFSLPMIFDGRNPNGFRLEYRFLAYGGVNF